MSALLSYFCTVVGNRELRPSPAPDRSRLATSPGKPSWLQVGLLVSQDDIPAREGDPGDADLGIPTDAVEASRSTQGQGEALVARIHQHIHFGGVGAVDRGRGVHLRHGGDKSQVIHPHALFDCGVLGRAGQGQPERVGSVEAHHGQFARAVSQRRIAEIDMAEGVDSVERSEVVRGWPRADLVKAQGLS